MSIKPILMNADMVLAILNGRKTVTRRLPTKRIEEKYLDYEEYVNAVAPPESRWLTEKEFYEQYPPYQPGDILYVRETYVTWRLPLGEILYCYKATDPNGNKRPTSPEFDSDLDVRPWKPSIHMPKAAARIFLRVTDVRMEQLQEIDDEQAKNEGANWKNGKNVGFEEKMRRTAVERFAEIWDSNIKKSDLDSCGWDANPWVWVIEFEKCEKPEGWCSND